MNYLERLKKYLQAQIKYFETEDPAYIAELVKHSNWFLENNKPKNFSPFNRNNDLITQEMQFEAMCAALEENGVKDAKELDVFTFYSRVAFFEKKSKAK